ncbi:PH domain-containing protein [Streptomyces sp. NBC_01462]|uniref:PH domain-containing protein n=1 Tax=Streptomyces sp. NBC_01462 TaxID=2903876 RepID=UPI002E331699|nr:PH domain-containing protein [Streptomyces sp. NBC_01462]
MATFNVRPDIDAAAAKLSSTFGSKREIQRLPEVLWEGESVEMLATGQYGGGAGLIAMTNLRLIFYKNGIMQQTVEDFPYGKISSVQWQGGMVMGTLTVYTSGNRADIKNMPKDQGKALADDLRRHIAQGTTPGVAPAGSAAVPAPAPAQDIASRLATLDELRGQGLLSDEEYAQRRTHILDSL